MKKEEKHSVMTMDKDVLCVECRCAIAYFKNLQLVMFQCICKVEKITPDNNTIYNIVQPAVTKAWNEYWKMKGIKLKI